MLRIYSNSIIRTIIRQQKYHQGEKKSTRKPKPEIKQLINEDRQFGGNELFIESIPKRCWFKSIRSAIVQSDWIRLKKYLFERTNFKCQYCPRVGSQLHGHQRWNFDQQTQTQKLVRLVTLCKSCHIATHMSSPKLIEANDYLFYHMKSVRNWNDQQYLAHRRDASKLRYQRSLIPWKIDISLLTQNNFTLTKQVKIKLQEQEENEYQHQLFKSYHITYCKEVSVLETESQDAESDQDIQRLLKQIFAGQLKYLKEKNMMEQQAQLKIQNSRKADEPSFQGQKQNQ